MQRPVAIVVVDVDPTFERFRYHQVCKGDGFGTRRLVQKSLPFTDRRLTNAIANLLFSVLNCLENDRFVFLLSGFAPLGVARRPIITIRRGWFETRQRE